MGRGRRGALRCLAILAALGGLAGAPARCGTVLSELRDAGATIAPSLHLTGQADLRFADGGRDQTPFSFNVQGDTAGVSSFVALDLHLFLNAALSRRTQLFVKFLGAADDGTRVSIESLVLATQLGSGWPRLEVGRFVNDFGWFSHRFLPADNPLIGEPLLYTYATALPSTQLPASPLDLIGQRGAGMGVQFAGYADSAPGQTMITSSWFVNGLKLAGSVKKLAYSVALTNEPVSGSSSFDPNDDKAVTVHLAYKPSLPLGIGLSYNRGAYLEHRIFDAPGFAGIHLGQFPEHTWGMDVDYAIAHFGLFAEVARKRWDSPGIPEGLGATGFFVEPRYKLTPGLQIAARYDRLSFDDIATPVGRLPWDFDAARLELGVWCKLERDMRLKASYEWNRTPGSPREPDDDLAQVQLVSVF